MADGPRPRVRRLVLASASPRRQQLARLLGADVRVLAPDVDEPAHGLADPFVSALSIALAKARAAAGGLAGDEVAVAADTEVVFAGRVLGKPATPEDARTMLGELRDRTHEVVTGVGLRHADGREWGAVVSTAVRMRPYGAEEVEAYVARGEPFDKAGGYAVQDALFRPVASVDGCYLNVVGLPVCAAARGLETLGLPPPSAPPGPLVPPCAYCRTGEALVRIE